MLPAICAGSIFYRENVHRRCDELYPSFDEAYDTGNAESVAFVVDFT